MLGIDSKAARYTWTAAVVLLLLGTLYLIRTTLLIFVIALLFAYLLYPLTDLIERHLDTEAISDLIDNGAPRGLPVLRSALG